MYAFSLSDYLAHTHTFHLYRLPGMTRWKSGEDQSLCDVFLSVAIARAAAAANQPVAAKPNVDDDSVQKSNSFGRSR